MTGTEIVAPDDIDVIATTNPDVAELTLTSCHPKWSTSKRIIVHSALVAEQSAPVSYAEGAAPTTTVATTTTAPTATTAPATTDTASVDTTSPTTIASPPTTTAPSDHWALGRCFLRRLVPRPLGDSPGRALGVRRVAAIAIGAHVLRRRFRSRLIGIGAGIVPFLIALYFFYQNVNRLLPPSL